MSDTDFKTAIDERLADALAAGNYRSTLNVQKSNAQLKLQRSLLFSVSGGTFKVSKELISFVGALIANGNENAVILDDANNPIDIEDLAAFQDHIVNVYHESVNAYMVEYKNVIKSRNVKSLIGE